MEEEMPKKIHGDRSISPLQESQDEGSSEPIPEEDDEDMNEINENVTEERVSLRRSSRVIFRSDLPVTKKESNRPIKLTAKSSEKDIKKYYLDKKVKRVNPSLETIFEEPHVVNDAEVVMSSRKYRRVINFGAMPTKNSGKVKKRKSKAKSAGLKKKSKKVPLEALMDKLKECEDC